MRFSRIAIVRETATFSSLRDSFEVHATPPDGVLGVLGSARFDLALLIELPAAAELTTLRTITAAHPRLPILVVSRAPTDAHVVNAFKIGATGYLYTADLATRLDDAIQEAILGGTPMSHAIARLVLDRARRHTRPSQDPASRPAPPPKQLSPRQREILVELAVGSTYQEIAQALAVSVDTVRTHVRQLYERLGVTTKIEAVMTAIELGIITRP